MDASSARASSNPGAAKVKRRLLASRSQIKADGHALINLLGTAPVPGQPLPDTSAAIAALSKHLKTLHGDIQRQAGGGARGKKARRLSALTIANIEMSLAKLAAASKATDQASAVKLIDAGLKHLKEAKRTSRDAGKALEGTWPI
jgi:hypothetical protein